MTRLPPLMSNHETAIDDAAWASPWRRRRVGEKVGLSLALILTALLTDPWPGCVLVALISLVLILGAAKIRPTLLAGVMAAPIVFLLIGSIPVAVHLGAEGWGIGPVRVTAAGLTTAVGLLAHGISGTLAVMVLATTTPMVDLLTWMRTLHVPDTLLEIASLTYRRLFVLLGTTWAVHQAQRARLGDDASWRRRMDTAAGTVGSIMLRSWQRAVRMQEGLEGRGYEDALVTLTPRRRRSWGFIAMTVGAVGSVWALNWVSA